MVGLVSEKDSGTKIALSTDTCKSTVVSAMLRLSDQGPFQCQRG